jgi:methionyl-tRNA synthetase
LEFSAFGNKYFNDTEIWTVIKTDPQKAQKIMGNLVQIISALRILIAPFMPEASENLAELISQNPNIDRVGEDFWKFKPILDFKLSKTVTPLFAKIDLESSGQ